MLRKWEKFHFGIFKRVLQLYKIYIIPQYITIYNTFSYVGAQITTTDYDVVQYHPYETIEVCMFIKDLVMWLHYNVILEKSDITKGHWQQLAISNNWNHLSAYVKKHR
jgi:hypothetical protein